MTWRGAVGIVLLGILGMGLFRAGEWVYSSLLTARALAQATSIEDLRFLRAARLQSEAAQARPAPAQKAP